MKKPRKRRQPFTAISLRLPAGILQRAGWNAEENGRSLAEVLRIAIEDAFRAQRAPKSHESREIDAPAEEWKRWRELAEHRRESVDETVRAYMNAAADFELGVAPSLSDDQ